MGPRNARVTCRPSRGGKRAGPEGPAHLILDPRRPGPAPGRGTARAKNRGDAGPFNHALFLDHARTAGSGNHPPRPGAGTRRPCHRRGGPAPPGPALADPRGDRRPAPGPADPGPAPARQVPAAGPGARQRPAAPGHDRQPAGAGPEPPAGPHDHVDLALDSGQVVRFTIPRRFGCLLWQPAGATHRPAPEPGPGAPGRPDFDGDYLFRASRDRRDQRQDHAHGPEPPWWASATSTPPNPCSRPASPRARAAGDRVPAPLRPPGPGGEGHPGPRHPAAAAPPSGTSSARTGGPAISSRSCSSTAGRASLPDLREPPAGSRLGNRATVWCAHCQR